MSNEAQEFWRQVEFAWHQAHQSLKDDVTEADDWWKFYEELLAEYRERFPEHTENP